MILPVLVPVVMSVVASAMGVVTMIMVTRQEEARQAAIELLRQTASLYDIQELKILESQAYISLKNNSVADDVSIKSEKKIIGKLGFVFSNVTGQNEEYTMVRFAIHDGSRLLHLLPEFRELWINKNEDNRTKDLVKKEDAYEGRKFIRIETFLYDEDSKSRMKYQEKSFWSSDEGIVITPKADETKETSSDKIYFAEVTSGVFRLDESGEFRAIDTGIMRIKMTREGFDIHDRSRSTGSTSINAKSAFEELMENEAQRIANKKAKLNSPKPSTNLEGMELRQRAGERS